MSERLIILTVMCLSYSYFVSTQIPITGECPSFECCKEPFQPLSSEKTSVIWYLYGGVPFFFDVDTKCTRVNVSSLASNYFYMNATQIEISLNQTRSTNGFGNFTSDGTVTTLISDLKFPIKYEIIQITQDYIILMTCSECGFFSKQGAGLYIYIYTTMKFPSASLVETINAKLEQCSIPLDKIEEHDQIGCQNSFDNPIVGAGTC